MMRLGDHCEKIGSGATPRGGREVYSDAGEYSFIRSQNIYNDGFSAEGLVRIDASYAKALSGVEVREDDVLLNITGDSVARACHIDIDYLPARVSQHVAIIRCKKGEIDPRFLRFYLISPVMQEKMKALASSGGTRQALTKAMIENFEIPDLGLAQQVAISETLGAMENHSHGLLKNSTALLKCAQEIFKDWFIGFGPTRAKMAGQTPYLAPEVWALFPDALDDAGLPEGWRSLSFEDMVESSIGGDWGSEFATDDHSEGAYVIRGTDFREISRGLKGKTPFRYISSKKLMSRVLQDMDIVIEVSGGSPTQPTGRSILITDSILERFGDPVVCASFCRRFRPKSKALGLMAALHLSLLYDRGGTWEYQNQSTGISNFQTAQFLSKERVIVPDDDTIEAFFRLCEPLIRKSTTNEIYRLENLRDELLPKLMSGELKIKDADALVRKTV